MRDKIFLHLYKNYFISHAINAIKINKLSQKYIDPFDIISKIKKQAYRLNIPRY